MARPKKAKKQYQPSQEATNLIDKIMTVVMKEVAKFDKKSQKGKK
ncbi:MAG TPA: hypothetical protein VGW78_07575 [Candidatus Babeliales bacterium]|jgi:hypothetical protein|nr:hypothetical protein [Candidatus Babeliales bacterium]